MTYLRRGAASVFSRGSSYLPAPHRRIEDSQVYRSMRHEQRNSHPRPDLGHKSSATATATGRPGDEYLVIAVSEDAVPFSFIQKLDGRHIKGVKERPEGLSVPSEYLAGTVKQFLPRKLRKFQLIDRLTTH